MQWMGLIWLILVVIELVGPYHPTLQWLTGALWVVFLLDFLIRFTLAPRKAVYLRHNILTAASLVVPALRMLRLTALIPALRAARGLKLARLSRRESNHVLAEKPDHRGRLSVCAAVDRGRHSRRSRRNLCI